MWHPKGSSSNNNKNTLHQNSPPPIPWGSVFVMATACPAAALKQRHAAASHNLMALASHSPLGGVSCHSSSSFYALVVVITVVLVALVVVVVAVVIVVLG